MPARVTSDRFAFQIVLTHHRLQTAVHFMFHALRSTLFAMATGKLDLMIKA